MIVRPGSISMWYRTIGILVGLTTLSLYVRFLLSSPNIHMEVSHHTPSYPSRLPTLSKSLGDVLFPVPPNSANFPWVRGNHLMLQALFHCIERSDCHKNQMKVVLLSSPDFRSELLGHNGGEKIWARSTAKALRNLGFTVLYTSSLDQTVQLYQMFPDFVRAILTTPEDAERCFSDKESCTISDLNPAGIQPWKVFSFSYWAGAANPLGDRWTLSPENYEQMGLSHNTYLGYSIEDACRGQPFIPHSQRENQAYILAKLLSFFTAERDRAWTPAIFDAATDATGIKYVIGAINDTLQGEWPAAELPSNHKDFGQIGQATFLDKLSRSRVLIGMGNPSTSPTAYDALCLGVPFINPVLNWDKENPTDRSAWYSQHPGLVQFDPPYVYNVFQGDLDGFVQAVKDAISHPIQSYVLERMRMSSVEERIAAIMEKDWESEALRYVNI